MLSRMTFATMRDELVGQLLLARAAVDSGDDAGQHIARSVELAAPEHLVQVILEEGSVVTRLCRTAAASLPSEHGVELAVALGAPRSPSAPGHRPTVALSDRELAVLRYLPSRLTNSEIGRECFMSVNTVKTHLKSIYAKLGVASRAEAVARAGLLGLL
jgi:LuxR family maltose regulon positive regulatory protein